MKKKMKLICIMDLELDTEDYNTEDADTIAEMESERIMDEPSYLFNMLYCGDWGAWVEPDEDGDK